MLYFLVIVIPFVVCMVYLIRRNNQVRNRFSQLLDRTIVLSEKVAGVPAENLLELKNEIVIVNDNLKDLELHLHDLEEKFGMEKSKTITNVYASRIKKLDAIEKKIGIMERRGHSELENEAVEQKQMSA